MGQEFEDQYRRGCQAEGILWINFWTLGWTAYGNTGRELVMEANTGKSSCGWIAGSNKKCKPNSWTWFWCQYFHCAWNLFSWKVTIRAELSHVRLTEVRCRQRKWVEGLQFSGWKEIRSDIKAVSEMMDMNWWARETFLWSSWQT